MAVTIFVIEAFIMFLFSILPDLTPMAKMFLDAFFLVVLVSPALYFFLFRPLVQQITERKQAEKALQEAHNELETKVQQRTAKLAKTNRELQIEISQRKETEEALHRKNQIQAVLNKMLSISMKPYSLEDMLNRILDLIVSIPWLSLESKGAIFVKKDEPEGLHMSAFRKLSPKLLTACRLVHSGKCLCGRALSTKQVQFSSHIDERHEIRYKGISPHGHYCVPILSSGKVLGVLNLYVMEGHRRKKEEVDFLKAIANGLAGIIERKRAEIELTKHHHHLEDLVRERTSELTKANKYLSQEIIDHKQDEEALWISYHFLEITNRHRKMDLLLKEFVTEIKKFTGCTAVGIRILDKEGNIPYQAYKGFSKKFYKSECNLSVNLDSCMCINIIQGTADPSLSFYTKGGSFFTGSTTDLLVNTPEKVLGQTRNACNKFGYESVALIPIRQGDRILGLIHLADYQKNKIPLKEIEALEKATMQLGNAIPRVQAEEALKESENKFRLLFQNMTEGVALHELIYDEHGEPIDYVIIDVNPAYGYHTNIDAKNAIGKKASELYGTDKPPYFDIFANVALTGQPNFFETYFEPMQRYFSISVCSPSKGKFATVFEDITEQKKAENILKDRQLEIKNLNKNLARRVQEEVQKSRQKDFIMMHQSRLAAMGEMIGNIAHQWKQPLNALIFLLYNIKDHFNSSELTRENLDTFIENGDNLIRKMSDTVDDFRNFFKPDKKRVKFCINRIIKESLLLIDASFRFNNISVTLNEEKERISIWGFANEYSQVILNVLNNARDSITSKGIKGEITIDAFSENGHAVVKIKDNGGGIPDHILHKIFEPYFTTKQEGKGTGIGLYMSKVIIEDHMGGSVEVYNNEKGAEFRIVTPIAQSRIMNQESLS
jgi:C4-dicarboxylate-specific signal transduction histidine kinase